ncbi:MAG TPA: hypothetical protein VNW94_09025 [Streptosporangiaceae bacterium]|nr:hypothetical protein [Streptosporangiaceae bacterium]
MNAMYLIYVPLAVVFVAFVVGGGIVLPIIGFVEAWRDRRPPAPPAVLQPRPADDRDHEKVAA